MEFITESQTDTQTEIKKIEDKLKQVNEEDQIIDLLIKLKQRNFQREEIVKSKIIFTIKQIKENYKGSTDIESMVHCLIQNWKRREENNKEEHLKTYEVIQLTEDEFNKSDIDKVCSDLLKNEIDSMRKTIKEALFTTIAKSKESYRLHQEALTKSKVSQTELAYLNKIKKVVNEIELGLYQTYLQIGEKKKYRSQAKMLTDKLENNEELIEKILTNKLKLHSIAGMTCEELMSTHDKKKLEQQKERCFEARRSDWNTIHGNVISTGMYKCGSCQSTKTTYFQIQIRRADEPMTTFVTCTECNKNWRC